MAQFNAKGLEISKRKYEVIGYDGSIKDPFFDTSIKDSSFKVEYSLKELIHVEDSTSEMIYALQEVIDSILDLMVGETLYVQLDRDNGRSKEVLRRIV